jgi:N12 class adenine-specific DNA methylase
LQIQNSFYSELVPNHLVGQWAAEFQTLYPTANVLAATKKDFEKQSRRRFCARIATGEWDAVIIGHSSFEKVPMSRERQEDRLRRDLDDVEAALIEAKENSGERATVKELARAKKSLEYQLKRLRDSPKDDLVTFEELGVDALMVDEAHGFKNKFFFSKMTNVAGLSKAQAKKSTDMGMKCEYINEQNGFPHGVIFATGTPISNSMVELFTMQSYLQREELERLGLNHFDNWAAAFGEVVSALELAPSDQGFRVRERFAKFVNLPELMNLFHLVADIQTADMLDLPVPKIMGGKPITVAVEPSPGARSWSRSWRGSPPFAPRRHATA